jgi:hypothetical protein
MSGMPSTYDIVTILIELQVKPDGIVWTATETVISLMVAPRIYYLLHTIWSIISQNILNLGVKIRINEEILLPLCQDLTKVELLGL